MAITSANWVATKLPINSTLGDAIESLNKSGLKIALVLNEQNELLGTITDGDIRRGILKGKTVVDNIVDVIQKTPIVCTPEMSKSAVVDLMLTNKVFQLPIVNQFGKVVGLNIWSEMFKPNIRDNYFVIMAGGKGTRLHPYTQNCPKAMIKIGDKPMMQLIIERAKLEGFCEFYISINHLGHMIEDYFGNGEKFGVRIQYLKEENFLGTAGSLSLLRKVSSLPVIVTNCDVLADVSYSGILDFHNANLASATMGVKVYEWKNPYGVICLDDLKIIRIDEKPIQSFVINAGIYVLDPAILNGLLSSTSKVDMTDIFRQLISEGGDVLSYPLHERWFDVGHPEDLRKVINS
jgi:dTDP-glucose pyrophosphorylase